MPACPGARLPRWPALLLTPLPFGGLAQTAACMACGLLLILLALRRGPVRNNCRGLERYLI